MELTLEQARILIGRRVVDWSNQSVEVLNAIEGGYGVVLITSMGKLRLDEINWEQTDRLHKKEGLK